MAEKNTALFYTSWLGSIKQLNKAQQGELFVALLEYAESGEKPVFNELALSVLFTEYSQTIDRDKAKYKERCEKNKANITKRWAKENTTVYDCKKSYTKNTDNDNDNDNDNDLYIAPSYKTRFHNFNERDNSAVIEELEKRG